MSERTIAVDVAIVGGGLAGLACAVGLQDSELNVGVFEASDRLGGRAESWVEPITRDVIDIGPHIVLSSYRNMLALLELLGTRERIVWQTDRLLRLREGDHATDMHLHSLPPPLHLAPSFAKVSSLRLRDKWSNWRTLFLAIGLDESLVQQLDQISAADLLRARGVTPQMTQWFWATACLAVMNAPLERCSAGALMRVFAQLIGQREYCIGFAGCGLSELFVPGAIRKVEHGGGRIFLDAPIQKIEVQQSRCKALVLRDGIRVAANHYVIAVPPHECFRMLPEEWRAAEPFSRFGTFEPSPYISSYLWFDRKLSQEAFWTRVWNPADLNSDFYDLSNIRPEWRERPSIIASNIIFSHRASSLSDEQIIARTHAEIADAFPNASQAHFRHAVVNRIPMAIPVPSPGTENNRPSTVTPLTNLLLAGDWCRTQLPSCMESAVRSGWTAAEAILRAIGQPRRLVLPVKKMEGLVRVANRLMARSSDTRSEHFSQLRPH